MSCPNVTMGLESASPGGDLPRSCCVELVGSDCDHLGYGRDRWPAVAVGSSGVDGRGDRGGAPATEGDL
jgi:hypothetical protein